MSEEQKDDRTIEETFQMLDGILQKLEKGDLSMEDSIAAYAKGMTLLKECRESIDRAEKKVLVLEESGDTHEF